MPAYNIVMEYPVKVNLIGRDGRAAKTVVFMGPQPSAVQNALKKPHLSSSEALLAATFGKTYKKLLSIGVAAPSQKKGGGQTTTQDLMAELFEPATLGGDLLELFEEPDALLPDTPDAVKADAYEAIEEPVVEEDALEGAIDIAELLPEFAPDIQKAKPKFGDESVMYVFDEVQLNPFDTVMQFKRKLAYVLGTDIYRIHLWHDHSGPTVLSYYLQLSPRSVFHPRIQAAMGEQHAAGHQVVHGLPIAQSIHAHRSTLKVRAFDWSVTLGSLPTREFNVSDLHDWIAPNARHWVSADPATEELVYYGFIVLYFPMLSRETFHHWIATGDGFAEAYPQLHTQTAAMQGYLEMEAAIHARVRQVERNADLLKTCILGCNVQMFQSQQSRVVLFKTLFDAFALSAAVVACKCAVLHDGRAYVLSKTFQNNKPIQKEPVLNSIIFRIRSANWEFFDLIMYGNGNYLVQTRFREEETMEFEQIRLKVESTINPIIHRINTEYNSALVGNQTFTPINRHNVKFTEVQVLLSLKKTMSQPEFRVLNVVLAEFVQAEVLALFKSEGNRYLYKYRMASSPINVDRVERNLSVDNFYSLLNDPNLEDLFNRFFLTKNFKVELRSSDVRFEVEGLQDSQFDLVYRYVMAANQILEERLKTHPVPKAKRKGNVKSFRQQDPALYDFRDDASAHSGSIYSKLCQKPFQPILFEEEEEAKAAAIPTTKYWNFTQKKPAYYGCPNPKYPNLSFIVNKHPKGYCIPCCKKTDFDKKQVSSRKLIYQSCIQEHSYTTTKQVMDIKYVMGYGKQVVPGRISGLPEHSLGALLSRGRASDFYIFGCSQAVNGVPGTAMVEIMRLVLEMGVSELITQIARRLEANPSLFSILVSGRIVLWFKTASDLVASMRRAFLEDGLVQDVPWEDVVLDLLYFLFDIHTMRFIDDGRSIKMRVLSYIRRGEEFHSHELRHLFILKKQDATYPIFRLNPSVYFKTKVVDQRILSHTDEVMYALAEIVERSYVGDASAYNLYAVKEFLRSGAGSEYAVAAFWMNKGNRCYLVQLSTKTNASLFLPMHEFYLHRETSKLVYAPFFASERNKQMASAAELLRFIDQYNQFYMRRSPPEPSRLIDIEQLLVLPFQRTKTIGFVANRLHWRVPAAAIASLSDPIRTKPVLELLYDPDEINRRLYRYNYSITPDPRSRNLYADSYHFYLYDLVLIEYVSFFFRERNTALRKKLRKLFNGATNSFEEMGAAVQEFYVNLYTPGKAGSKISLANADPSYRSFLKRDLTLLDQQVKQFLKKGDLKETLSAFDGTFFDFDLFIHRLNGLTKKEIIQELQRILPEIIQVVPKVSFRESDSFPNLYVSCMDGRSDTVPHCGPKLRVPRDVVQPILNTLAVDITNQFKLPWFSSLLFGDRVFNFFKFNQRPQEQITVRVV